MSDMSRRFRSLYHFLPHLLKTASSAPRPRYPPPVSLTVDYPSQSAEMSAACVICAGASGKPLAGKWDLVTQQWAPAKREPTIDAQIR